MDFILNLPAPFRHLLVLLSGVVLSWGGTELIPFLQDESNVLGGTLAAVLSYLIAYVTPLVTSYGVGAARARELGARTPSDLGN